MVNLSLECSNGYGPPVYQEDHPSCGLWFDQEYSNEPTQAAKSWLSNNSFPETKTALCSAKAPIQHSRFISQSRPHNPIYLNIQSPTESKEDCMTFCDYCPGDKSLNPTIENYETSPKVETTTTHPGKKVNHGTMYFCISLII